MVKNLYQHKIMWLASYPKSGNTWFRAFLSALMNDGAVAINSLKTDGIFSDRAIFDNYTDIESRDLYNDEAKCIVADVYRQIAKERNNLSLFKVHDIFDKDRDGNNIFPEDVSHCAVYLIRNPLDVAGSLANHLNCEIQKAVDIINDPGAYLSEQADNSNRSAQFPQHLSDWSGHVAAWTLLPSFPVLVLRYEDMLNNTFDSFQKVIDFIGWDYTKEQINKAIEATRFDKLSMQEIENGFFERGRKNPKFFRSGTSGNWNRELNEEQILSIIRRHGKIMQHYNYSTNY